MRQYAIRFEVDGRALIWERCGPDLPATLEQAGPHLEREYNGMAVITSVQEAKCERCGGYPLVPHSCNCRSIDIARENMAHTNGEEATP